MTQSIPPQGCRWNIIKSPFMCHQCSKAPLSLHGLQKSVTKQLLPSFHPDKNKNNHIIKGVTGTWVTFLQTSTTWLWTVGLDERRALPLSTPVSPRKAERSGECTGCFVLGGKLSPYLSDTAQHHKPNEPWGRDIKNYLQKHTSTFPEACSLRVQTPAYSSKQNRPRTEVLLHQPLSSQLFLRLLSKTHLGPKFGHDGSLRPFSPVGRSGSSCPGFKLTP